MAKACATARGGAGLVGGDNKAGIFYGTRTIKDMPMGTACFLGEGCGYAQDISPSLGEAAVKMREAQIIADAHAQSHSSQWYYYSCITCVNGG